MKSTKMKIIKRVTKRGKITKIYLRHLRKELELIKSEASAYYDNPPLIYYPDRPHSIQITRKCICGVELVIANRFSAEKFCSMSCYHRSRHEKLQNTK